MRIANNHLFLTPDDRQPWRDRNNELRWAGSYDPVRGDVTVYFLGEEDAELGGWPILSTMQYEEYIEHVLGSRRAAK